MKLAFSTLAFPDQPLPDVLARGREWGYDGVELRLVDGELIDPSMSPGERARIAERLRAGGLPVVAVDSSIAITAEGAEAELARFLTLAAEWEAPLVRVFGGKLPPDPDGRQAALQAVASVLERAAVEGERLGVGIGLETHDDFSASAVVAEVMALVQAPSVGVVWDSHHPHRMGETPEDIYRNVGGRLSLVQVKDAARSEDDPSGWRLVLLGEGEVPVRRALDLLAANGYRGWVSVEWEKRWHPEIEEPDVALPQHRELLGKWMQEGPSQPDSGRTES